MYDFKRLSEQLSKSIKERRSAAISGSTDKKNTQQLFNKVDTMLKKGDADSLMKLGESVSKELSAKLGVDLSKRTAEYKELIKDIKNGANQQNNK